MSSLNSDSQRGNRNIEQEYYYYYFILRLTSYLSHWSSARSGEELAGGVEVDPDVDAVSPRLSATRRLRCWYAKYDSSYGVHRVQSVSTSKAEPRGGRGRRQSDAEDGGLLCEQKLQTYST